MPTIKLTTWNIEHLAKLVPQPPPNKVEKLEAVKNEIAQLDPDILCIVEGPGSLPDLRTWVNAQDGLGGQYQVATIPGTEAILQQNPPDPRAALQNLYAMQGSEKFGNQWIWFLVRDELFQNASASVQNSTVWQGHTNQTKWRYHQWGDLDDKKHSHWRHPQVLTLRLNGQLVEIIGAHLKSKINQTDPFDAHGNVTAKYVRTALKARVKLATEAYNVRRYIEKRFEQEPNPHIFVCGDMNDGPGRGYFEREYLFFDVVTNVQSNPLFAKRTLYHALSDFDAPLRWTTEFRDKVEEWSRQLPGADALPTEPFDPTKRQFIDHILFTQALADDSSLPFVEPGSGLVEHTIHQQINASLSKSKQSSDHTPVSVNIVV
jgi:endonuclease/exonuclease/phosphatase family metal-dependent hydrolase